MSTYFERIFKPCFNELMNIIPGKKSLSQYIRMMSNLILPGKTIYPDIVMVITTRCSLKCKNCNNLMPCYDTPYHIDADQVISDIDRLLENTDMIIKFGLIGGEPFVYPELSKVLTHVLNSDKIMYISLTTNGTVIPNNDLLKLMENPKVIVELSDYGLKTQKIDEMMRILSEHKIKCVPDKVSMWVSPGGTEFRGKDKAQLAKEYQNCYSSKYCHTVLNGKVFLCARGAHLYDLGFMKSDHDYFDIRTPRSKKEFNKKLQSFLLSDYADACNYCDHALKIPVKPGEQKED